MGYHSLGFYCGQQWVNPCAMLRTRILRSNFASEEM